jgi:hypothetical protein
MPHLVQMQAKYASQGLVVVSVNLDNPGDADTIPAIQQVLGKRNMAALTNVLLDEEQPFWKKKFRIAGVPCVYVFNRDGKWTQIYSTTLQKDDGEIRHEMLEAFVVELLKEPAKSQ